MASVDMAEIMKQAALAAATVNASLGVAPAPNVQELEQAKTKAVAALEGFKQDLMVIRQQEKVSDVTCLIGKVT